MSHQFNEQIAQGMLDKARLHLEHKINKCSPTENKTLVIIGGQPGAGKSSITKLVEERFNGNIVTLNGDDFKTYFPNYKELLAKNPDKTADLVQPYSNYVVDHLKNDLIDKRLNVMVEGTMRTLNVPINTIDQFKNNGYTAEAYVVSVNQFASRVGCIERYENDVALSGSGRSVKLSAHDEVYSKIPITLQGLLESNKLTNITIMDRDGNKIAELAKGDDIVKAYTTFRNEITLDQYKNVADKIDKTMFKMYERGVAPTEYSELKDIKKTLTNEFTKQQGIDTNSMNKSNSRGFER